VAIIDPGQIVSLHSVKGVLMYQFGPSEQVNLQWGRQLRDVSQLNLQAGPMFVGGEFPSIYPWVHWCSVWSADAKDLYWTGPVQKITANPYGTTINAKDPAAYMAKTRVPITKSWDGVDPAIPTLELWQAMAALHNLPQQPIMRRDPWGDLYDLSVTEDSQMLDKQIKQFEQYGLRWTVVAGVGLLGPMPLQPIASLGPNDFIGDALELVRDGTNTVNDILLKGGDDLARARVDLGADVNLQGITTVNNMFGVSNVQKATAQYVRQTGMIKTDIDIPQDAVLHPDANVRIEQLVPSARFAISAYGLRLRMELESIDVSTNSGNVQITPTFNEVPDWTELGEMQQNGGQLQLQAGVKQVSSP
jgi:hypothetical protein